MHHHYSLHSTRAALSKRLNATPADPLDRLSLERSHRCQALRRAPYAEADSVLASIRVITPSSFHHPVGSRKSGLDNHLSTDWQNPLQILP